MFDWSIPERGFITDGFRIELNVMRSDVTEKIRETTDCPCIVNGCKELLTVG